MKNQTKPFFVVLAIVVVTGLIFSLYAYSKIRSIRELRTTIDKIGTERARAVWKDADGGSDTQKSIPQKMWTTEFIETAYTVSQKYRITDMTFEQKSLDSARKQTPANIRLTLQSYPVKITFHAGYREMAEFIRELQDLERLVTVDNLKVKSEKSYLAVEITLSTYAMEGK